MGSRLVGPIGMLIQLSLLARWLDIGEFNQFLQFYATLVVVSSLSDGGQRNLLFVALRTSKDFAEEARYVEDASRIKVSIAAILLLTGALLWIVGGADWLPISLAVVTAIVAPPSDINLFILRSKLQPNTESALLSIEQVILVALLLALKLTGNLSWVTAASLTFIAGFVRANLSRRICRMRFGFRPHLLPRHGKWHDALKHNLNLVRIALPAAISITAANLFNRYPALALEQHLRPHDYAVFIAFLTLLQRGQLVIFAVQQAGFQSHFSLWRKYIASARGMIGLGLVLATPVVLVIAAVPHFAATIYVGNGFADSYIYDVYAALLMLIVYPICAVQQALQLARRNSMVTIGAAVGIAVQVALLWVLDLHGADAILPYAAGSLIYLAICTVQLWRVPSEQL